MACQHGHFPSWRVMCLNWLARAFSRTCSSAPNIYDRRSTRTRLEVQPTCNHQSTRVSTLISDPGSRFGHWSSAITMQRQTPRGNHPSQAFPPACTGGPTPSKHRLPLSATARQFSFQFVPLVLVVGNLEGIQGHVRNRRVPGLTPKMPKDHSRLMVPSRTRYCCLVKGALFG